MKYVLTLIVALSLFNCAFNPDVITGAAEPGNSVKADSLPSSILYGLSYFDSKNHFVKIEAKTGTMTVLSTLDTITTITGPAVVNPDLGYYCFVSYAKLVVINVLDGSIVKSFTLSHLNTSNMEYNSNTKKLNALSYYDGQFHFVEIDVAAETMNSIQTLAGV